ncbi:MAG TPA: phosphatidylserine/phosphatidylglycerophosphate/cardiolipin synthase family protein [bacterium]|nr:phosphatidylserine/phosphatidylglycerophosphate/cardiolipin synthase family protein [bacterium]
MLIIKNIEVDPPDAPNDGSARVTCRCTVFTPNERARITAVRLDLSPLGLAAEHPLSPTDHVLPGTAEGVYETSWPVPLLTEPGHYELPLFALDSEGAAGRQKAPLRVDYRRPAYPSAVQHPDNRRALETIAAAPLTAGNRVTILDDGRAAFDTRLAMIESATRQINLQSYTLSDEGESERLVKALLAKAEAGVEVNVLLNADTQLPSSPIGTLRLRFQKLLLDLQLLGQKIEAHLADESNESVVAVLMRQWQQNQRGINLLMFSGQLLRDAGIVSPRGGDQPPAIWLQKMRQDRTPETREAKDRLTVFNGPGGLPALPLLDFAIHEKILVIDGERAIIGGRNIDDRYFFRWLDMDLLLTGPLVHHVQQGFLHSFRTFSAGNANVQQPTALLQADKPTGEVEAQFIQSRPWRGEYQAMRALISALQMARDHVFISSQYVILPDCLLRDALLDAARRGVEIRILTNSYRTCQEVGFSTGYLVSLNYLPALLAEKIRLFEIDGHEIDGQPQPYLHVKEFLIDGELALVGSFNLSIRSCYIESENLIAIHHPATVVDLEERFLRRQSAQASEITAARWSEINRQHKSKIELARYAELLY